jgi:hypothetical protein
MTDFCSEERFLGDVKDHVMTIVRDDGRAGRHIRFKKPGTMCMHFDVITWPGYLCYTGDMGTYVFRRLEDMFEFFRTSSKHSRQDRQLFINPAYWGEKLESIDRGDGFKKFSREKFAAAIKDYYDSHVKEDIEEEAEEREMLDDGEALSEAQVKRFEDAAEFRKSLWEEIESDVLDKADSNDGGAAIRAAMDFECDGFEFRDFWETNCDDYTFRFIWCCYALAWGIEQYDKAKEQVEVAA